MKILVADDREDARYLLETLLKANGHIVEPAGNGVEALERLKSGGVDLIVSDILMPVMDGFQLCRKVKTDKALRHIPFIIYTATYTGPKDEEFALKIGADRFIIKPCEPDTFIAAVRDVMEHAKHRDMASTPAPAQEEEIFKLYNERLVRKLEQKMLQLEKEVQMRKETEKILRESEEKYRTYFKNALDVIYSIDSDFKLLSISPSIERVLGYKPEELIGKPFTELNLLAPESLRQAIDDAKALFKGDRLPSKVYEFITKSGENRFVEVSGSPMLRDGKVVAYVSVARDVTERKKSEQALKESNALFRTAFENAAVGMALVNRDGIYIEVNAAMAHIIGYTQAELVGKPVASFTHPEDLKQRMDFIDDLVAGRIDSGEQERRFIHRNGSVVWVLIWASVQRDSEGRFLYFISMVVDITKRKKAEEEKKQIEAQFQHSQKMEAIGTLAGGIAHDFNNILSAIIGYSELALMDIPEDTKISRYIQEVQTAGERAKDLVKQILTFARQTDSEAKPIQVKHILKEALKLLKASTPSSIEIREVIESDAAILADPTQIHQVTMNLFTNALHAMKEDVGVITVQLKEVSLDNHFTELHPSMLPGSYLQLRVEDTGCGIRPDILKKIFDPYFTTKKAGEGTGLGLSVVKGIVEGCKGTITIKSEVGKGSVFDVYFPIIERKSKTLTSRSEDEKVPAGKESILLVDDEIPISRLNEQILTALGYRTTMRTSPIEALELFKFDPDRFDLVITDMTMPKMSGDLLAIEMKRIRPDIPVILCTGYSKRMSDERAIEIGINAVLMKPVVKLDLAKTIRKVLDEPMNTFRHGSQIGF